MEKTSRLVVGTWGGVAFGLSLFWLALVFLVARCRAWDTPDLAGRWHEFIRQMRDTPLLATAIGGMVGLHIGLVLCAKAVCNPPQFWRHTGRHLAMASGLAWPLAIALFVAFALMPK